MPARSIKPRSYTMKSLQSLQEKDHSCYCNNIIESFQCSSALA